MGAKFHEVLRLPTHVDLIPDVDPENPSDEHDIFYNQHCTDLIKARLNEKKAAGERVELLTRYPKDVVEPDFDTRDLVSLDDDGEIIVLDRGDG